jgi:hypothetical protein
LGGDPPIRPFPGRFREFEGVHVTIRDHMNRLKGALGWSLAVIGLTYVLVIAAVGAIAR